METPAGLVFVTYHQEGKKVKSVKLINVPAYLDSEGLEAECPDLGMLRVDVAYGGNFYAIVDVQENFAGIEHYTADKLVAWARALRRNINVIPAQWRFAYRAYRVERHRVWPLFL